MILIKARVVEGDQDGTSLAPVFHGSHIVIDRVHGNLRSLTGIVEKVNTKALENYYGDEYDINSMVQVSEKGSDGWKKTSYDSLQHNKRI